MSHTPEKAPSELHHFIDELGRSRGDLALQLHLMSMDMKTRWHGLEKKWEGLRNEARLESGTLARQIAEELKDEYAKLKQELRKAS